MSHALGTRLRHLVSLLDGDVERAYLAAGLHGYRPRYTPVVRALQGDGPLTIRALAERIGLSHSALSQTVAQMERAGWVATRPGRDARSKQVSMSSALLEALPLLVRHWDATDKAAHVLEQDIGVPLAKVIASAVTALESRSFGARIQHALSANRKKR